MRGNLWRRLAALAALGVVLCGGCGYRVTSGGDFPSELESVYVVMFVNRTLEPYLERQLTDRLIVELQRSGRYEISEDRAAADLLLEG